MIKREANTELMAHWMLAWRTLGRWQALNARLSRDAAPLTSSWARHSSPNCRWQGVPAVVSTPRFMVGG